MSWKGTKENISNLPQSGNQIGDLWHVNEDGNEYAWDGSKWEALGGIHSSDFTPFEIPVTQSGSTYTTTATAAEILANIDNCVLTEDGSVLQQTMHEVLGSYAVILFSSNTSINGYVTNVSFVVTIDGANVSVDYYSADARPELPIVASTDNGKFLCVVNGAWAAQAVPAAESNSFGGSA